MRDKIGRFFIVLGLVCLGAAVCWTGYNFYESYRADKLADKTIREMFDLYDLQKAGDRFDQDDKEKKRREEGELPFYRRYPDMDMPTVTIDGVSYVGFLEVPDKDLDLPVQEECSDEKLKISPCRFAGTIYLHNMVIAGHNYISHFWPLKSLPEGSEIIFTDMDKNVFRYELSWTDLIEPDDGEQMVSKTHGEDWDLTLYTCTMGNSMRYALRCILVEEEPGDS